MTTTETLREALREACDMLDQYAPLAEHARDCPVVLFGRRDCDCGHGERRQIVDHIARLRTLTTEAAAGTGEPPRWRREVVAFADVMEAKLRENDHKGGWRDEAGYALLDRLREETTELDAALRDHDRPMYTVERVQSARRRVLREAADVANFAMMVADVCNALPDGDAP